MEGMLHLKVLRADRPHAKIIRIETQKAKFINGVVSVLTYEDIPGLNRFGLIKPDQPVLCEDRVRFSGDAVVIVAAETEAIAAAAIEEIDVEYVDLPTVLNARDALDECAPLIHPEGNLCSETKMGFGDVERELSKSKYISKITYSTGSQEHAYLETETGISYVDDLDRIAIVCGGQNPFSDRRQLSSILALEENQIWVKHPPMGGAFGGKEDLSVQAFIALVTLTTKRPAKLTYTRHESFAYSVKRHRFDVEIEVGADAKGALTGFRAKLLSDTGAYTALGPAVMTFAAEHAAGPYKFQATEIIGRVAFTNSYNASAFRGFGNPQVALGIEQAMDELAVKLRIDPIEFRCKNALTGGDRAGGGQIVPAGFSFTELAEQAKESELLRAVEKKSSIKNSVGVAFAWQAYGLGVGVEPGSTVRVSRSDDGLYTLELSQPDLGEGNHRAFLKIAANELECAVEDVLLKSGSTDQPNAWSTTASRSIAVTGSAVMLAAAALRARIIGGEIGSIVEEIHFCPNLPPPIEFGAPRVGYTCGILLTSVQLDEELGEVKVLEADFYVDPGRVVCPEGIVGQIQGAIAQGIGFALTEDLGMQGGFVHNQCFSRYGAPRAQDVPYNMHVTIVQSDDTSNPLGARGVGEIGLAPTAPAIANALQKITGMRFNLFPLFPERVFNQTAIKRGPQAN